MQQASHIHESTDNVFNPSCLKEYQVVEIFEESRTDTANEHLLIRGEKEYLGSVVISFKNNKTPFDKNLNLLYKKEDVFYKHVENRIFNDIYFPKSWAEEGIGEPNIVSKEMTKDVCFYLYENYDLMPNQIVPNREEGLSVFYKNYNNNRSLIVEIYNSLEIAALVNDDKDKKVILCEDVKNLDFKNLVKSLKK